jgi:hypothetical protein
MVQPGDPEEVYAEFPKYVRIGYVDSGDHCDTLLKEFMAVLPGDGRLPNRWRYRNHDSFMLRYGRLGVVLWASSYSSHLLFVGSTHVLRIWTDARNHCWVDGLPHVLKDYNPEGIPLKNIRKSKPFSFRAKITDTAEMSALAKTIKTLYGV